MQERQLFRRLLDDYRELLSPSLCDDHHLSMPMCHSINRSNRRSSQRKTTTMVCYFPPNEGGNVYKLDSIDPLGAIYATHAAQVVI